MRSDSIPGNTLRTGRTPFTYNFRAWIIEVSLFCLFRFVQAVGCHSNCLKVAWRWTLASMTRQLWRWILFDKYNVLHALNLIRQLGRKFSLRPVINEPDFDTWIQSFWTGFRRLFSSTPMFNVENNWFPNLSMCWSSKSWIQVSKSVSLITSLTQPERLES